MTTEIAYIGTTADPAIISNTQIQKFPSVTTNSTQYTIIAKNTLGAGITGTAYTEIRSGATGVTGARILQVASRTSTANPTEKSGNINLESESVSIYSLVTNSGINYDAGVKTFTDPSNNVPACYVFTRPFGPGLLYGLRLWRGNVEMFSGILSNDPANIAVFTDLGINFKQTLTFDDGDGAKNNSIVLVASTSGTYTMTIAGNAFKTTINTPTASRNFDLPNPFTNYVGYWYGICNKSTSFTIQVRTYLGVNLYLIPVSPAGGAGSFAQFTIDTNNTYFRSG